jgi:transcriptional antiterminator NusG
MSKEASKIKSTSKALWYVVHTYSGYEDVVAQTLTQRAENLGFSKQIIEILVPKEKRIEIRNGKRKTVEKKIFPGYIMVEMIMGDDAWFVVRNTPNVTGFVGSGATPIPMSSEEVRSIKKRMGQDNPKYDISFTAGELVSIVDGPFKGFDGSINDIDEAKGKIKVLVNMFGRETPVELDSLQVKKI